MWQITNVFLFFFLCNFWNAPSLHWLRMPGDPCIDFLRLLVCLCMSIFLCIVCSCERRETKKESDRQKERQRFPEDRSRGRWSLPVYYMGLSYLHSPHMCREFDRAQYWFHTASDVSISWSHMNSVFTSCRTGSFCTQRDLNVCCLTYEAEGKRAVKVLIRLWRAEVVLLFFQMKGIQPTVSPYRAGALGISQC